MENNQDNVSTITTHVSVCTLVHGTYPERIRNGDYTTCHVHEKKRKMADEVFESQRSGGYSGPPYPYQPYGGAPGDRG